MIEEIMKIQNAIGATDFVISKHLSIYEEYYSKIKKEYFGKDDIMPERLKEMLGRFLDNKPKEKIEGYYKKQTEFMVKHENLNDVLEKTGMTVDDISDCLLIPTSKIKKFIESRSYYIEDKSEFERCIDYLMFLDESEDLIESDEVPNEPVEESNVEEQCDMLGECDNAEVKALERQIDWYEDIIGSFCKLTEMLYKKEI